MYWQFNDTRIVAPAIPFHALGSNTDLTLTLVTEADETIEHAYLCLVDPDLVGLIAAKRATEGVYKEIRGMANANCYIGYMDAESELDIDFRISFPSEGPAGLTAIQIMLRHSDGAALPLSFFFGDGLPVFWYDDWSQAIFWKDEWA